MGRRGRRRVRLSDVDARRDVLPDAVEGAPGRCRRLMVMVQVLGLRRVGLGEDAVLGLGRGGRGWVVEAVVRPKVQRRRRRWVRVVAAHEGRRTGVGGVRHAVYGLGSLVVLEELVHLRGALSARLLLRARLLRQPQLLRPVAVSLQVRVQVVLGGTPISALPGGVSVPGCRPSKVVRARPEVVPWQHGRDKVIHSRSQLKSTPIEHLRGRLLMALARVGVKRDPARHRGDHGFRQWKARRTRGSTSAASLETSVGTPALSRVLLTSLAHRCQQCTAELLQNRRGRGYHRAGALPALLAAIRGSRGQ